LGDFVKGDHPTTPATKPDNRSPKTAPLKLSNKTRNEMNRKLESLAGLTFLLSGGE
jgi:hypothetical protein